jgi:uncharacterized protein (TIGR01777 family)
LKVTVVGASGFVGRHLVMALVARGDRVIAASVRSDVDGAAQACDGADAVVVLAGESIAQRWTEAAKRRFWESRVDRTHALIARFAQLAAPPKVYVSASATGYYPTSETATYDESSPPGDGFLARLCIAWEAAADEATSSRTRVAKIRTGLVLGTDGGTLKALLPLFRLGLGGPIANGRQWYSWIHIDDLVGIYLAAIDGIGGVLNATAPNPVTNAEFTRALASAVRRPAFLPVPAFAPRLILGEGGDIAILGQRVLPERTLANGYRFTFETVDAALTDLLAKG